MPSKPVSTERSRHNSDAALFQFTEAIDQLHAQSRKQQRVHKSQLATIKAQLATLTGTVTLLTTQQQEWKDTEIRLFTWVSGIERTVDQELMGVRRVNSFAPELPTGAEYESAAESI